MMKQDLAQTSLQKEDLTHFCKSIAHMSEIYVKDFYNASKIDWREEITKDQFMEVYPLIKDVKFIKLLLTLIE